MKLVYIFILLLNFLYYIDNTINDFYHPLVRRKIVKNEEYEFDTEIPQCDEEKLMSFLAELGAINPESIVNLPFQSDLDQVCRRVTITLDQIDEYLQTCNLSMSEDLYIQLIKGVKGLYDTICKSNKLKKQIEKYFTCYKNLNIEYLQCQGPPDWTENKNTTFKCQAYKAIADCYFIKTSKLCGTNAAEVLKKFLRSTIDKITNISCPQVQIDPVVLDPMPEVGKSTILMHSTDLIALTLMVQMYV